MPEIENPDTADDREVSSGRKTKRKPDESPTLPPVPNPEAITAKALRLSSSVVWTESGLTGRVATPRVLTQILDERVIDNDHAKRQIAIALHNHSLRSPDVLTVDTTRACLSRTFDFVGDPEIVNEFVRSFTMLLRQFDPPTRAADPNRTPMRKMIAFGTQIGVLRYKKEFREKQLSQPAAKRSKTAPAQSAEERALETATGIVARSLYFKRRSDAEKSSTIDKEVVLILGNTGTGKSFMVNTACRSQNIPFVKIDGADLTSAGYQGYDASAIPNALFHAAEGDEALAGRGVVFIDEIDKKASTGTADGLDVGGRGAQQSLLAVLEDFKDQASDVDMSGVTWFFAGSFVGLADVIRRRLGTSIGFQRHQQSGVQDDSEILKQTTRADLIAYGMIPELVGRINRVTVTDPMTEDRMVRILTTARNSVLQQKQALLQKNDVSLRLTDGAIRELARVALEAKVGARALKDVVGRVTEQLEFEAPDLKCPQTVLMNSADVRRLLAGQ